jgi:hypothetical protein
VTAYGYIATATMLVERVLPQWQWHQGVSLQLMKTEVVLFTSSLLLTVAILCLYTTVNLSTSYSMYSCCLLEAVGPGGSLSMFLLLFHTGKMSLRECPYQQQQKWQQTIATGRQRCLSPALGTVGGSTTATVFH